MQEFNTGEFIEKLDRLFDREDTRGAGEFLREQYGICAAAGRAC